MKLFDYANKEVKLINQTTGEEVRKGDTITTFRGEEQICRYINPPHKSSSVGHVNNFYASVFNLKFVRVDEK